MKQLRDPDGIIILLLISVLVAMSILFLYCYGGKFATDQTQKICDCVYELNWPDLPHKLQKYVILMLSSMQRPLYYHGFNIVFLDLSTFSQVSCSFLYQHIERNIYNTKSMHFSGVSSDHNLLLDIQNHHSFLNFWSVWDFFSWIINEMVYSLKSKAFLRLMNTKIMEY